MKSMRKYNFDESRYEVVLKDISVDIETLEIIILKMLNLESFKNQIAILDHFAPDRTEIYDMYQGKLEPAISYCMQNGWIKKIKQDDLIFEQQFYGEDIVNTLTLYKIGNLGLSEIGAKLYNEIELKMDEIHNRRSYEDDIEKIIQKDKILLVCHYENVLQHTLQETISNLYKFNKCRGIELEINYTSLCKINKWVVRRYTILESAYVVEISYKIINQVNGSLVCVYFG